MTAATSRLPCASTATSPRRRRSPRRCAPLGVRPLSTTALPQRLRVNNVRLGDALLEREQHGRAVRDRHGWRLPH